MMMRCVTNHCKWCGGVLGNIHKAREESFVGKKVLYDILFPYDDRMILKNHLIFTFSAQKGRQPAFKSIFLNSY